MKLLWVKSDFLHPTTRGGQIRTLEIVKRLHRRNEVHYLAYDNPEQPEGLARSSEYCSKAHPIEHHVPGHRSIGFAAQLAKGLFSPLPVAVSRYGSPLMAAKIRELTATQKFDAVLCDFIIPAQNFEDLSQVVLFQHNVETMIWKRHVEYATNPLKRAYLQLQADRMLAHERDVCRRVRRIIAVSQADADLMESMFGVKNVAVTPTGVDIEYFQPAGQTPRQPHEYDLSFVGSMDWLPNIDGMKYFVEQILPLIRNQIPGCSLAICGRNPSPEILNMAANDPKIKVTGTVSDIRPYMWGSRLSIVPLRIGGGTRLKIYEAMAANLGVVSTTVGAEGLDVTHPVNIRLADTPESFAGECVRLLTRDAERDALAAAGFQLAQTFSWDRLSLDFEEFLKS